MTDKKKVQVVVDASSGYSAGGGGPSAQPAFDFSKFQQQVYGDPANPGATADFGFERNNGGACGVGPNDDDTSSSAALDAYVTSYQMRKTSIVDGVSSEALVEEHRKSIANITLRDMGRQVLQQDLCGVTLSRRHQQLKTEYEAVVDDGTYQNLQTYAFGDAFDGGDGIANEGTEQ